MLYAGLDLAPGGDTFLQVSLQAEARRRTVEIRCRMSACFGEVQEIRLYAEDAAQIARLLDALTRESGALRPIEAIEASS